ncbi:MAG: hypothetical protein Q9194_002724 [Teloschistes cf. exilis]
MARPPRGPMAALQVLVSIQSMILGSEWPLENNPGFENAHLHGGYHEQQCLSYNEHVRKGTVRYAILDWLKRREMRDGIWSGVLREYIRFCGRDLVQTWKAWEKPNERKRGFLAMGTPELSAVGQMEVAVESYRKAQGL